MLYICQKYFVLTQYLSNYFHCVNSNDLLLIYFFKFIKTFETGTPVNYFPSKYFYALADTIKTSILNLKQ